MAEDDGAVRGGHISFEQAEGIIGRTGKAPVMGPRAAEVLAYFGAVALVVATLVLAYDVAFGALSVGQRSPSVPTQLALFATAVEAVSAILVLVQIEDPLEPSELILSGAPGSMPHTQGGVALVVGA